MVNEFSLKITVGYRIVIHSLGDGLYPCCLYSLCLCGIEARLNGCLLPNTSSKLAGTFELYGCVRAVGIDLTDIVREE